jgi:ComF family protein
MPPTRSVRADWWRAALTDVVDLLFPRVCLTCQHLVPRATPSLACRACWARVTPLPRPQCPRCGHPGRGGACHWCRHLSPSMTGVRSCCWADNPTARDLLHAMKYDAWSRVADDLAVHMARLDVSAMAPPGQRILVPVPLAEGRLKERGYNQSERLARALGRLWGAPAPLPLLRRTRETPSQTRLTLEQRLTNVANAFQADAGQVNRLGDVAYFLVDDVITTGATLNACADALASAGARTICSITFGRARDPRDAAASRGKTAHGHSGRH